MKGIHVVLFAALMLAAQGAQAALKVFACEPEWGALVRELAGGSVEIYTATTARQDPHRVEARPSLIAKMRTADLLVCTGAELEAGWLPLVLRQSGNGAVQPGRPGHFAAADYVDKLEIPKVLDRSEGDVHASGNPHIQTDPGNIARVAEALAKRMAEIDPGSTADYRARHRDFAQRWETAMRTWQQQAAPLRGVAVVAHHRSWPYLYRWLGLVEVAELEPKPGLEPTAAHLDGVLKRLEAQPARMVIRSAYEDGRADEWFAARAGIPAVELPFTVGASAQAKDLFGLYEETIQRLLGALK